VDVDLECLKVFLIMIREFKDGLEEEGDVQFSELCSALTKLITNKKSGMVFKL
jgi:hypothetical protein